MHKEDKTGAHGQGAQHRGDNLGALVRDRGYIVSWEICRQNLLVRR